MMVTAKMLHKMILAGESTLLPIRVPLAARGIAVKNFSTGWTVDSHLVANEVSLALERGSTNTTVDNF